jgi:hypothetical protein
MPLDWVFYRLSSTRVQELAQQLRDSHSAAGTSTQDEDVCLERLHKTSEENKASIDYFNGLTHQFRLTTDSVAPRTGTTTQQQRRPHVAICEHYYTMLHSGCIEPIDGYLTHAHGGKSLYVSKHKEPSSSSPSSILDDIDVIILCTGYQPTLEFLDKDILQALDFDSEDAFLPLLAYLDVLHPNTLGLYFVGMYRGPYFGILQLQAVGIAVIYCMCVLFICPLG